jgi:hypothetical protein
LINGMRETIVMMVRRNVLGEWPKFRVRVLHGNTNAGLANHDEIVQPIANGEHLIIAQAMSIAQFLNHGPLVSVHGINF